MLMALRKHLQTDQFVGDVEPTETFDALNVQEWHADGVLGAGEDRVFDSEWYGMDTPSPELDGLIQIVLPAKPELPIDSYSSACLNVCMASPVPRSSVTLHPKRKGMWWSTVKPPLKMR